MAGKEKILEFTLEDLIAKKLAKEERQNKVIEVTLNKEGKKLKLKTPKDKEILNLINEIANNGDGDNVDLAAFVEAASPLIYSLCPMLHKKELLDACDIKGDNYDIVEQIFDIDERMQIAEEILNNSSVNLDGLDKTVKN
jgi:hypothetical protein